MRNPVVLMVLMTMLLSACSSSSKVGVYKKQKVTIVEPKPDQTPSRRAIQACKKSREKEKRT